MVLCTVGSAAITLPERATFFVVAPVLVWAILPELGPSVVEFITTYMGVDPTVPATGVNEIDEGLNVYGPPIVVEIPKPTGGVITILAVRFTPSTL